MTHTTEKRWRLRVVGLRRSVKFLQSEVLWQFCATPVAKKSIVICNSRCRAILVAFSLHFSSGLLWRLRTIDCFGLMGRFTSPSANENDRSNQQYVSNEIRRPGEVDWVLSWKGDYYKWCLKYDRRQQRVCSTIAGQNARAKFGKSDKLEASQIKVLVHLKVLKIRVVRRSSSDVFGNAALSRVQNYRPL